MFNIFFAFLPAILWNSSTQKSLHLNHHEHPPSSVNFLHKAIPGGSPLRFCDDSHETDLYSIDHVELVPDPLYIDDSFEVHLFGNFFQNITKHATWTYLARYDNSTEYETGTMDFCESLDHIDQPFRHGSEECPPEKGYAMISMSAWVMPMFIVPGKYYFRFDAATDQGDRIYCLDAEIYLDYKDKGDQPDFK